MSARFTVADLAVSGILDIGTNRQRVAEAAGLPPASREQVASLPQDCHRPPPAADFWPLLLAVLGEPRKVPALGGEDALQALIVHNAREGARTGRWSVLVVMRRNDIRVRVPGQAQLEASPGLAAWGQRQKREAQREGARAAALGLIRGFTDLDVLWPGGVGYLEVKVPGAYPSPEQRAVHALLRGWGHRVEVVRSWAETLDVWKRWGVPGA